MPNTRTQELDTLQLQFLFAVHSYVGFALWSSWM